MADGTLTLPPYRLISSLAAKRPHCRLTKVMIARHNPAYNVESGRSEPFVLYQFQPIKGKSG